MAKRAMVQTMCLVCCTIIYVILVWERKTPFFQADNCVGQNKKETVMYHFAERVGTGLHREINYHLMEPGHIKCICDGCFGKVRQLF